MDDALELVILGAGLSGLSLACFLQDSPALTKITLVEKEDRPGGLCRTFFHDGMVYDIGPHILFSKDAEILRLMLRLLGDNQDRIRRSNRILHKGVRLQYPFENDLSRLPAEDLDYCLNTFINNPYENYTAENMLQFFLKTFGEGITNLYLRPYNEKIWKFDPSFMDTQMVERIPKPPVADVLASARGKTVDGYTHQLYFHYPLNGGIEAVIQALMNKLGPKASILCGHEVHEVEKHSDSFTVRTTPGRELKADRLISTMPLERLAAVYGGSTPEVRETAKKLKYNSLRLVAARVAGDKAGDNFAFTVADKRVVFHRCSKIDFLGAAYSEAGTETYMLEITCRKGDMFDSLSDDELIGEVIDGLGRINFIGSKSDVKSVVTRRFEHAYVIYDLEHRQNVDALKHYFDQEKIILCGRFGTFEYLNMDQVIKQARGLSETMLKEGCL